MCGFVSKFPAIRVILLFYRLLKEIPRKFKLYVPKGASRKSAQKGVPSRSEDDSSCKNASKCSDDVEEVTTADKVAPPTAKDVGTQTEVIVTVADVSCQTDCGELDELAEDEKLPEPERMSEGNNDTKFHPSFYSFARYVIPCLHAF